MSDAGSSYRYFAVTSPGLETLLNEELSDLGISSERTTGGVSFKGPLEALWSCANKSRIAESIRLRLKPFRASNFATLEQELSRLPWHAYLTPRTPVEICVSCSGSRLYHTTAIEERLRRVLDERLKRHPTEIEVLEPLEPQKVFLRFLHNEVQVSIDATGERLHRRGYRTHVGIAPIRETLAAAAIRIITHINPNAPTRLWDPCCGSGTLLCEWLQSGLGIWPGFATHQTRSFAFEHWPVHPTQMYTNWRSELKQAPTTALQDVDVFAYGTDRDRRAIDAARHNLEQARVPTHCRLINSDFSEAEGQIPTHTAVITNLPYGVRLKRTPYSVSPFLTLDALLRRRRDLRPALVITSERPPQNSRNQWSAATHFLNGGLRVTAWTLT